MKKTSIFLIITLFFLAALATSCDNNKDNNDTLDTALTSLDIKIENGNDFNDLIDEVRLVVSIGDVHTIATAKYLNGGFKADLPATMPDNLLRRLIDTGIDDGVTVSNPDAKCTSIIIYAYNADGRRIGKISCLKENTEMTFLYADSDVTASGNLETGRTTTSINISLRKGWNKVYVTINELADEKYESVMTTTEPGSMKWYLDEWYSE